MLFAVVFERDLQLLAIPVQLQALEKLWTNLVEGTTERTRKKLAHIGFAALELVFSGAIEYLLTETRQTLEKPFTIIFQILMKLRKRVPILDGDIIVRNSLGEFFYARRQTLYTIFLNPEAIDEGYP